MRRPSMLLLAATWTGLLAGGTLGNCALGLWVPLVVAGVVLPVFDGGWARLAVLAAALFLAGVLLSPDASWNRTAVPPGLAAAAKVPVVLKVATPFLAAECSDRVVAMVTDVVVGPTALAGRKVMLRGFEEVTPPGRSRFTVCGKFGAPAARLNPYSIDMRTQYARLVVLWRGSRPTGNGWRR
jgi:hypothetical protein